MSKKNKRKVEIEKKKTDKFQFSNYSENTLQRSLSIRALKKAKELEKKILKSGAKYVRIDKKTLILKKICAD